MAGVEVKYDTSTFVAVGFVVAGMVVVDGVQAAVHIV